MSSHMTLAVDVPRGDRQPLPGEIVDLRLDAGLDRFVSTTGEVLLVRPGVETPRIDVKTESGALLTSVMSKLERKAKRIGGSWYLVSDEIRVTAEVLVEPPEPAVGIMRENYCVERVTLPDDTDVGEWPDAWEDAIVEAAAEEYRTKPD